MKKREIIIGAAISFIIPFCVYLYTVAPTLSFWDCGELIACGYSLGVPHPPASPFLTILIRIFTLIPFGKEIGFRANMLSVICTSGSALLIWLILLKIIEKIKRIEKIKDKVFVFGAGLSCVLIYAFSYTIWWDAVETETYAISTFLSFLLLYISLIWGERFEKNNPGHKKYLILIAYLGALGVGIHLAPLLVIPPILISVYIKYRKTRDGSLLRYIAIIIPFFALCAGIPLKLVGILFIFAIIFLFLPHTQDYNFIGITFFLMLIGISSYIYLPIRARADPRINETAPTTPKKVWASFTREQYGPSFVSRIFQRQTSSAENNYGFFRALYEQITHFFGTYLTWQWVPYPRETRWEKRDFSKLIQILSIIANVLFIGLCFYGLWNHYKKEKETFYLMFAVFIILTLGQIFVLNFKFSPSDPNPLHQPREVRERHYFFDPAFAIIAWYIGLGIWSLIRKLENYKISYAPLIVCLIGIIPLISNFWSHDNRRGLWIPDDYGYNMLMSCEENACLITNGDNDTFPLWFMQEVKNIKPSVNIANLSLLNTEWHIKHLKKRGVPISLSDFVIDNLIPYPVIKEGKTDRSQMILVKDIALRDIIATNGGYKFEPTVFMPIKREMLPREYRKLFPKDMDMIPPSYYVRRLPKEYWVRLPEEYFWPQEDFAALIVKNYNPKIPIYFAVTCSPSSMKGFEPSLQMQGLVYKLMHEGVDKFNIEVSDSLLRKVYKYRGIFDDNVYKDENTKGCVLTNYSAVWFALGIAYKNMGKIEEAIEIFEFGKKMSKKTDAEMAYNYQLMALYQQTGRDTDMEKLLKETDMKTKEGDFLYLLGSSYIKRGETAKAKELFQQAIKTNDALGYAGLLKLYYKDHDTVNLNNILKICTGNPNLAGKILSVLDSEGENYLITLLLNNWLSRNPFDTVAKKLLKEYEGRLKASNLK